MLEPKDIKSIIEKAIPTKLVEVQSEDNHHFDAIVISSVFEGLSLVKRQQLVYKSLGDLISTGELHALSLKTYTNTEWQEKQNG